MGQKKAPVTQAVEHGDVVLRAFDDAWANGDMDRDEQKLFRDLLQDWYRATKAARASVMTGLAFMKGIETESYQNRLVAEYRESLDELPAFAAD